MKWPTSNHAPGMKTMQESRSLAQGISIIDDTAKATAEKPK
jgi:hypothetical protein